MATNMGEFKENHVSAHVEENGLQDVDFTATKAGLQGQVGTNEYGQPLVQFDPVDERRLVAKIDLYVIPIVAILYLFCFIDRVNIGNARLAGLEEDLGLQGYQYNQVLSVFYISYIVFEIPGTMACKWLGPGWFLPATTLAFGGITIAFAYVRDIHAACAVRFLLGIFEAPMLPGIAYYLSRWYRRSELAFRLALYVVMAPLAGAFGGLLASAILTLDSVGSTTRWEMIFVIEGIITIGLALIACFILTDRPETARWLSENQKLMAVSRLKSERIGATEVLDKFDRAKLLRGILNPTTLVTAWIFLLECITVQGLAFFAPTIVRTIYPTYPVVRQQLMTVPPYVLGAVCVVGSALLAWKLDRRNSIIAWSAVPVIAGYTIFLATENSKARYGAIFIIVIGAFNGGALCNAQVSANVVSDTARSSAIGTNVMFGNVGGLIATWAFLPFDGPNFPIGNGLNLAVQVLVLISGLTLGVWLSMDNKKRERNDVHAKLQGLSQQQISDLEWRHPGFKWCP